jgi:L-threonylcarbamoyladenylate synthase
VNKILNMLSVDEIADLINEGAVGVVPTDTIYGVVASARIPAAVQRVYTVKHRHHKPGTLIAASIDQFVELGIPRRYLKAVEQFWPNPISVVIPVGEQLKELHLGTHSLACRIPKVPEVMALLEKTGPLLTSSANHTGQAPSVNLEDAQAYFGDEVDFYVDGGDLSGHKPSTVIRIVDDAIEVLREGAVKISETGEIAA